MRPKDLERAKEIEAQLVEFSDSTFELVGIAAAVPRQVFVEQVIESIRRVDYAKQLGDRPLSPRREDPSDELFDPLKAAVLAAQRGETDRAYWLVFLFVYFGRHSVGGWHYIRQVYGCLGTGMRWDWARVSADPLAFGAWIDAHQTEIRAGQRSGFGNHRKYESFSQVATAVADYVAWVNPPRSHQELLNEALANRAGDGSAAFGDLYRSLSSRVRRFGRTATFDYLCMIGKLGLTDVEPDLPYLGGATGPLAGARLLVGARLNPSELNHLVLQLGGALGVGMQVLEDSLCNWQKSPNIFRAFRG